MFDNKGVIPKMKKVIYLWVGVLSLTLSFTSQGWAFYSPHPMKTYEQGLHYLDHYQGDQADLDEAQKYFTQLIEKHPNSPFGYLGMSRVHIINAYLHDNSYNMKEIKDDALPFAVKALSLGPSLREVHENYSVFEKIFEEYEITQTRTQESLTLFPEKADTYFEVGQFLSDQSDYERALVYYKASLNMDPTTALRLKLLKRIAHIYLERYDDPRSAAEYYTEALKIWEDAPAINEFLGVAYLKMQKYDLAIERFTKALNQMTTPLVEYYLLQAKGYLSKEQGNLNEAIGFLEQAASFKKRNSTLAFDLGNLYYEKAKYDTAFTYFSSVIEWKPQDANAYYFAGRSAQNLGKEDLAISYFKKYLQMKNDSMEADWIRQNMPAIAQQETASAENGGLSLESGKAEPLK